MKTEKGDTQDSRLTFPRINLANKKLSPRKSSHPYQWYSWKYNNTTGNRENSEMNRVGRYIYNDIGGLRRRGNNSKRNDNRNHLIWDAQDKKNENSRLSTSTKNYQRLVKSKVR